MSTSAPNPELRARAKSFAVNTAEQWDVICSAVRFELMEFLSACGPCSIAELAAQVGAKADSLYHHIRKLVATGFVVETGFRRSGRRTEALYDVAAERFDFDAEVGRGSLMKLMRSIHRRAERNFEQSLDADLPDFSARHRNSYVRGETARLSPKELKEVKLLLQQIMEIFENARTTDDGKLFSLTFNLMPLARGEDT